MKKLNYYPTIGQTYPFSISLYIAAQRSEEERLAQKKEMKLKKAKAEKKPRFKLAFNLW